MVWPIIAGKPLLARHVRLCSKASQRGREWNEPWQTDEPIECVCWELFALLLGAPVDEVAGVEGDAKKIGGDKFGLGGAEPAGTDNGGLEGGDHPTVPASLSHKYRRGNGPNARERID